MTYSTYNIEYLTYNTKYSIYKTAYPNLILNKPFITVYYIEFPIRVRGFPNEMHNLLPSVLDRQLAPGLPAGPMATGASFFQIFR